MRFIICKLHVSLRYLFRRNSFVKDKFFGTKQRWTQNLKSCFWYTGFFPFVSAMLVILDDINLIFKKIHVFPKLLLQCPRMFPLPFGDRDFSVPFQFRTDILRHPFESFFVNSQVLYGLAKSSDDHCSPFRSYFQEMAYMMKLMENLNFCCA